MPFRSASPLPGCVALVLALTACREPAHVSAPAPATATIAPDVIGRAGPVTMTLADLRTAVEEARVFQMWRTGEAPPVEALRNPMLRRRVLSKALETRVVRDETAKRGLALPPEELAQALEAFAAGKPLGAPGLADADPTTLDGRMAARYGADPQRARQAAADLILAGLLADALLADTPDETLRRAWDDEQTQVRVDLVQVPRVPTTQEIDRAVRARAADVEAFYQKNLERFRKPERAMGRRVIVGVPDGAGAEAREAARLRAEALRARVAGGEDLEKLASAESAEAERRRGGLVGPWTREQGPELYELGVGELSPVRPHRLGWMFFRTDTRVPASVRPVTDSGVQREIAAEILRTEDTLPHAREVAERVRHLLRTNPGSSALGALVKAERLQRETTPLFDRAAKRVPGIGLAPVLFDAVFRLTEQAPVTEVVVVRQHYVVARRVDSRAPDPAAWPAARHAFAETWKGRERAFVVDRWLNERLRGEPLWIDGPRVDALTLDDLGVGPAQAPK